MHIAALNCKRLTGWIRLACALSVMFAGSAHAQKLDATTSAIDIKLNGTRCESRELWVVIEGVDAEEKWTPANRVRDEKCRWTATADRRFNTRFTRFSLRLDHARTDCHKADAILSRGEPVAQLVFDCCSAERLRSIAIFATPSLPVSYVRDVARTDHSQSRPCLESRTFLSTGTITHVQFGGETLFLQLGSDTMKPRLTWLNVNALPEARSGRPISLSADEIRHRLSIQYVKGNRSGPSLPVTAMDIDIDNLKELKLKELRITPR